MREEAGVEPGFAALDELRVDAEAFAQLEAGGGGPLGQFLDPRPGALGVDVVDGDGGDAAPVVDAGGDEPLVLGVDEVGRGLEAGGGAHDEPGDGDGGDQVVQLGVGHPAHGRVRLGAEVLDDQFLDRVVRAGHAPQREERFGALLDGLADAEEQPARERHGGPARVLQDAQAHGGVLVGEP